MAKRRAKAGKKRRREPMTGKVPDGKKARPGMPPAREALGAERQVTALELRQMGYTFTVIGEQLGITRQSAHEQVHKALAELAEESRDRATELRELEVSRIDRVLAGVFPRAERGEEDAVRSFIRLSQRRALLLGLDIGRGMMARGTIAPTATGEIGFTFEVMGPASPAPETQQ
jgi:hypothetical protein